MLNQLSVQFKSVQMERHEVLEVLGYPIYVSGLEQLKLDSKCLISTLNQYSYVVAEKDRSFRHALMGSDIILPDGISIVVAARLLNKKKIKKIAGADLHLYLLNQLSNNHGSCYYLGSSEKTLAKIRKRMEKEYPSVRAGFYSPPYKDNFSDADTMEMISEINAFKPDVLFVGMTAPKQEKWAFENKELLDVNTICSIGAVFDFYAETVTRASPFWINLGLEWFIRLVHEPVIMWRR
jgi:N-acetylglucosaminyldiphosphoundecaprenol N-acetyl-beta-D-mannosaminyltransferase